MIKLYGLLPKRADLTEEEFHHHWAVLHAALGARIAAMRHYVQNHRLPAIAAGIRPAVWDGVAECWFESAAAADIAADPDYTDNAGRDDPTFLDLDRLAFMAVEEVERIGGGSRDWTRAHFAPGAKVLWFVRKRPGVGTDDFRDFMAENAQRIAAVDPAPASYTHGVPIVDAAAKPLFDGVEEIAWTGRSLLESAWHSRAVQEALVAAREVVDVDGSAALVVRERRVY
jgi:uncharacterized protein (TIGR02118 family)